MNSYSNQEMCRMSWFLVELESNPKSYSIIHLVDLVVEDSTNIYIDRKVQFYRDTRTLSGIIIAASDDRKCIETELRKLMSLENDNDDQEKWLLVQHCKGNNNLVHSVINKNEITLHPDQKYQKRQVYINCNNVQRPATILCICDTEEQTVIELQCLKKRCFDVAFDDSQSPANQNPEWYLVQYSCGTKDIIYAVISYNETVWRQENLYKGIVVYIRDGTTIYQAIIIKRSNNRDSLDFALANIKDSCLLTTFPIEVSINSMDMVMPNELNKNGYERTVPTHSDSDCSLLEIDLNRQQEDDYDRSKTVQKLEAMSVRMQQESSMITNAFKAIDRVRRGMDRRLLVLDNMLSIL